MIERTHRRYQRTHIACRSMQARLLRCLPMIPTLGFAFLIMPTVPAIAGSEVNILMTSEVVSDAISQSNPKALPGAIIEYQMRVSYSGHLPIVGDSVAVTNAVPASLSLVVGDGSGSIDGPFVFVEGAQPSDLNCLFQSLADIGDCVEFSSNNGATFDYQPTPDYDGTDAAVTHLRFRPRGIMQPATSAPSYFILRYRMKVD